MKNNDVGASPKKSESPKQMPNSASNPLRNVTTVPLSTTLQHSLDGLSGENSSNAQTNSEEKP